jgi:bacterioferritin-associated ferredoxin
VISFPDTPKLANIKRVAVISLRRTTPVADVICVCNGVWEEDLKEYLQRYPVASVEDLRDRERICNKCRQCEPLIQDLIDRQMSRGRQP